MALWNGLGQAATLAQLAGVDAGGLVSMIIQAVQTVRHNREECRQLGHDVTVISGLLQLLQQLEMMRFPVIRVPLGGLEDTLRQVYMLVTSCQHSSIMYRFFMAGNQAQKFRDVRDRINFHLQLYPMISHIHITYFLSGLYSRVHPLGMQPQAFEEVLESFASQANPDSRSGVNSEITMSATGSEVPCALLSGITEFTLTTLEAATQHFPGENITERGGHSQVYIMQKIVIKVSMASDKSRSKAMALIAKADGVSSIWLTGDERDQLEVAGCGVDTICLVQCLRKKVGAAVIMKVEKVRAREAQPVGVNTEEARPAVKPANMRRRSGIRAIITKLVSKFMRPHALRVEQTENPAPAASGGPRSHRFSVPSTSTAVSAAAPPSRLLALHQPPCTQDQAPTPSASPRRDLSGALLPMRVAPVRRRRRVFNMSRVRRSARLAATRPLPQGSLSPELGVLHDDPVDALQDYVGMFDGPLPPAVIAALTGAVFHLDDEDDIQMGNAVIEHGTADQISRSEHRIW